MSYNSDMAALGFITGPELLKRAPKRLILGIDGLEKVGKTRFCLTAPAPIAYFNIDLGTEGVIERVLGNDPNKQVHVQTFHLRMLETKDGQEAALAMWARIVTAYRAVLNKSRTVVIDTASELWDILRLAAFGKLSQVKGHHYGPVNSQFRDLIRLAYDSSTNLILVHKLKPEYSGENKTGRYERSGFGDTGFMVQVNATLSKDLTAPRDRKFKIRITDCRQNTEAEGQELQGDFCTFPFLAMSVLQDTTPDDWKDTRMI